MTGAPAERRIKTYSSQTGYAYQYFYAGRRPDASHAGVEFVFQVSFGRVQWKPVSVFLRSADIASWQTRHARDLSSTECYALAKMALFQAFDESPAPDAMRRAVIVNQTQLQDLAITLGFE